VESKLASLVDITIHEVNDTLTVATHAAFRCERGATRGVRLLPWRCTRRCVHPPTLTLIVTASAVRVSAWLSIRLRQQ